MTGAGDRPRARDQHRLGARTSTSTSARQEDSTTDEPDIDRLNFTAVYSYALTEVVSANLGYRFRTRDEGDEDADINAVFFEIGRSFATRP